MGVHFHEGQFVGNGWKGSYVISKVNEVSGCYQVGWSVGKYGAM